MSKAAKICAICVNKATEDGNYDWLRIKKSTQLNITQNPETETFDFIADETPSEEIKQYSPSIEQDLAVMKGEPDYEWFYSQYKKHPVGVDAHFDFLLIYIMDGNNEVGFYSVRQEAILSFTDFNAVDGVINYKISFCGTPVEGTTKIADGVYTFTEAAAAPAQVNLAPTPQTNSYTE